MPRPHEPAAPCQLSVGRMASNEKLLLVALLAKKKRKRRSAERKVHVCASYMYYPEGCTQECIIHFSLICVQTKRSQCPPLTVEHGFEWKLSHYATNVLHRRSLASLSCSVTVSFSSGEIHSLNCVVVPVMSFLT